MELKGRIRNLEKHVGIAQAFLKVVEMANKWIVDSTPLPEDRVSLSKEDVERSLKSQQEKKMSISLSELKRLILLR